MEILSKIQQQLKAPKNQMNTFGNYKYRSCEDILEAVKPLLGGAVVLLNDDIVLIGDRYYVKSTATIKDGTESVSVSAFARESLEKKGMDVAQITGASSSYARKYALNGLFCIDDTKDADTNGKPPASATDTGESEYITPEQVAVIQKALVDLKVEPAKFCSVMQVDRVEDLLKTEYPKAQAALNAKRKKLAEEK
ncbi:MAG: ERF family protein [Syntrophorhabdaceae bacterium]|jgi:hypothetical protein|nr:ERF family protein [Syntrophorhabdaceae bacterium]